MITHEEAIILIGFVQNGDYVLPNYNRRNLLDYITEQQAKDKVHEELVKKHDELVRDVERYFECSEPLKNKCTMKEYTELHYKLSKVGETK